MKKIILFLLISLFAAGMIACGGNAEDAQSAQSEEQVQYTAPTGPFSERDMIFVIDGIEYPISSAAAPLLEVFGANNEMMAAPSCAFIGEDKQFVYDFATVYTYPMDDVDLINEIYIYGGEYTTSRGIGLGATLEEVKTVYGDTGIEQGRNYVYVVSGTMENTSSPKLYFELTDGVVSGISFFGANGVLQ